MNVFRSADILLPAHADMQRWAVIACDQFTSDAAYWRRVRECAGENPSTIHMILPEAELGSADEAASVARINETMVQYLHANIFACYPDSYIYVERTLQNGSVRPGLIGCVDLEAYDYRPDSVSPIRATEKTVLERIPPRQRVRKDAALEFPHVLMLCDDDGRVLIEPIGKVKQQLRQLYDFDLMEEGGHITGWLVDGEVVADFDARLEVYTAAVPGKYADLTGAPVVLAVGDGNHSLATAKSCYEALKASAPGRDLSEHPARHALVELENIHDPSQVFEPIHRVLFQVDTEKLLLDLAPLCGNDGFAITCVAAGEKKQLVLDRAYGELAVAILQNFLDEWLRENGGGIDYIHGDAEAEKLAQQPDAIAFLLRPMEKHELFRGVIAGGVLPRKTFSMGHAREKRYYLEGRKIK